MKMHYLCVACACFTAALGGNAVAQGWLLLSALFAGEAALFIALFEGFRRLEAERNR